MRIAEERRGEVRVLKPLGPLTGADAQALAARMAEAQASGPHGVVLDLSGVAYVDSRGLEVLVDLAEQQIRTGGALKVCGAGEMLREVFELTELAALFEQFDGVEAAVGSLA